MTHLFISYARENEDKARRLEALLVKSGFSVWRDRSMIAGDEFQKTLEQQIHQAQKVLLIWTREASKSRWVLAEAELGASLRKLIPISYDAEAPPLGLRGLQFQTYDAFRNNLARFCVQLAAPDISSAELSYKAYQQSVNGYIQILGMSEPLPLERIYVNLRVNPQISSKKYTIRPEDRRLEHRRQIKKLAPINRITKRSLSPLDALIQYEKLVLLGGPGCGKTTLLKYWTLLFTGNISSTPRPDTNFFPIFIVLRSIRDRDLDLMEIMSETLERGGFQDANKILTDRLRDGRCLLLLDGLDELERSKVLLVHEQVRLLIERFPKNKFVLTCRTASYLDNFEGFAEVEIESFDQAQKYSFVEDWFGRRKASASKLKAVIRSQPHISELATTPILLSLICILFDRDLALPKNRTELYARAVDAMLRDWDSTRNFRRQSKYESLSDLKKLKLLSYIAFSFFTQNQKIFYSKELIAAVSRYIPRFGIAEDEAHDVIREIASHHGLIVQVSADAYAFSHLTLQEYFTACHVVDSRKELDILSNTGDPRWIEVFSAVVSLLEDSSQFLRCLLDMSGPNKFYGLCLSAYCISGQVSVLPEIKVEIVRSITHELGKTSEIVKRLYRTHATGRGTKAGLFFELEPDTGRDHSRRKGEALRFLATVNCLAAYFDAMFVEELNREFVDRGNEKISRIVEYLKWCKLNNEAVILYSDRLPQGGIELPVETTQFESRIAHALRP
jgi:predicted NACHT family NTPase